MGNRVVTHINGDGLAGTNSLGFYLPLAVVHAGFRQVPALVPNLQIIDVRRAAEYIVDCMVNKRSANDWQKMAPVIGRVISASIRDAATDLVLQVELDVDDGVQEYLDKSGNINIQHGIVYENRIQEDGVIKEINVTHFGFLPDEHVYVTAQKMIENDKDAWDEI